MPKANQEGSEPLCWVETTAEHDHCMQYRLPSRYRPLHSQNSTQNSESRRLWSCESGRSFLQPVGKHAQRRYSTNRLQTNRTLKVFSVASRGGVRKKSSSGCGHGEPTGISSTESPNVPFCARYRRRSMIGSYPPAWNSVLMGVPAFVAEKGPGFGAATVGVTVNSALRVKLGGAAPTLMGRG